MAFKMNSPLLHGGKHPSKKDGHTRATHKGRKTLKGYEKEKEKQRSEEYVSKLKTLTPTELEAMRNK
jgi:hypothetical protein